MEDRRKLNRHDRRELTLQDLVEPSSLQSPPVIHRARTSSSLFTFNPAMAPTELNSLEEAISIAKDVIDLHLREICGAFADAFAGKNKDRPGQYTFRPLLKKIFDLFKSIPKTPLSDKELINKREELTAAFDNCKNEDFLSQITELVAGKNPFDLVLSPRKKKMLKGFVDICKTLAIQTLLLNDSRLSFENTLRSFLEPKLYQIKAAKKLYRESKATLDKFKNDTSWYSGVMSINDENLLHHINYLLEELDTLYKLPTVASLESQNLGKLHRAIQKAGDALQSFKERKKEGSGHLGLLVSASRQLERDFAELSKSNNENLSDTSIMTTSQTLCLNQHGLALTNLFNNHPFWSNASKAIRDAVKAVHRALFDVQTKIRQPEENATHSVSELYSQDYLDACNFIEDKERQSERLIEKIRVAINTVDSYREQLTAKKIDLENQKKRPLSFEKEPEPTKKTQISHIPEPTVVTEPSITPEEFFYALCREHTRFIQAPYWESQHNHWEKEKKPETKGSSSFFGGLLGFGTTKEENSNKKQPPKVNTNIGLMRNHINKNLQSINREINIYEQAGHLYKFKMCAANSNSFIEKFGAMLSRSPSTQKYYTHLENLKCVTAIEVGKGELKLNIDLEAAREELYWLLYFIEKRKHLGMPAAEYFKDTPAYHTPEYAKYRCMREEEEHKLALESESRQLTFGIS